MMSSVIVYGGPGTSNFCVKETINTMTSMGWGERMMVCTEARTLVDTLRQEERGILVMPGGRDKPYQECLGGEGVEAIKEFVGGGGHYLGICAGAYFASARVVFEKGTEMEVDEERDLRFFPGTTYGTLFKEKFKYSFTFLLIIFNNHDVDFEKFDQSFKYICQRYT